VGPIVITVVVPVVVAAGYFALWACATAPASLRSPAPLPDGKTAEFGLGGVVGKHVQPVNSDGSPQTNPDGTVPDTRAGGGAQFWLTGRRKRFEVGGNFVIGSFGFFPTGTGRLWVLNAERFRLGIGGELGLGGGAVEIPLGFGLSEGAWIYTAPRVRSGPNAIVVPAGLAFALGGSVRFLVEGGGIVYRFGAQNTLDNLGLRYYGAAGVAFPF
jgi:hypothetical protein